MSAHKLNKLTSQPSVDVTLEKSWKYLGYRQYSQFLASDNDFLIVRRFSVLHIRILLALQDEIVLLEQELSELDRLAGLPESGNFHNGTFRDDEIKKRSQTLALIKDKLIEYDDLLEKASKLRAIPRARAHDVSSISTWLHNNNEPIRDSEVDYLTYGSDLIPLVPKPRTHLRRLLEHWAGFRLSSLWRFSFLDVHRDPEPHPQQVVYTSDERIERFLATAILCCGLVMLISPLWILHAVDDKSKQLGIITAYIVVFVGLLSFSTVAKPFESLAAAAAYSAVLMVFLQLG